MASVNIVSASNGRKPPSPLGKEEFERRQKVLPEIARRYLEGEELEDEFGEGLAKEYRIPKRTLLAYFKRMGVSRKKEKAKAKEIQAEIRRKEVEELSTEAEKIATIAIGIGGIIARRYLPLLDALMAEGKTLEYIAEDIMNWYEMKAPTEATINKLKSEIAELNENLGKMFVMTQPNFRYMLRAKILERYAKDIIKARTMGVRLSPSKTLQAMHNDLLAIEDDIGGLNIEQLREA
jgi:hypothetical protein